MLISFEHEAKLRHKPLVEDDPDVNYEIVLAKLLILFMERFGPTPYNIYDKMMKRTFREAGNETEDATEWIFRIQTLAEDLEQAITSQPDITMLGFGYDMRQYMLFAVSALKVFKVLRTVGQSWL